MCKQNPGLKTCWKEGLTGNFPTQYHPYGCVHAFCIWEWKHTRARNHCVYLVVSGGPKEAENHLRAQRHKRGNHLTEIPRQAVSVTYYQQQSHKLSLKGSLSKKQKPKPYKLDVFKKNPGVIWEEVVSMKNMPPPPIFGRFYRSQDLRSISKPGAMSWCWL